MKGKSNNSGFVKAVAAVLAVLMICSLFVGVISMRARAVSSIESLKQKKQELAKEKENLKAEIKKAEDEQYSLLQKKKVLDRQMEVTQREINNVLDLIDEYTAYIAQCEKDIVATQEKEKKQWDAYKRRVRAMEEDGSVSYLDVLFTSSDLSDLLSQIDFVSEIMEKDKKIYNNLVETRKELERVKKEREDAIIELEKSKQELSERKSELDEQIEEASQLIKEYEASIDKMETDVKEIEAEDAKVDKEIKAAQEAGSKVVGEGSFIWPSEDSRYVTSKFGARSAPTAGASTNHKGIDIGASKGTNILAAKSGTVRTSSYSSSYGNYVVINHGDGTTTTYAHMSQRLVSVGEVVKQGQVIGLVGSTGVSTGPHIHFEITVNGARVDPLQYFSNYTLSPRA